MIFGGEVVKVCEDALEICVYLLGVAFIFVEIVHVLHVERAEFVDYIVGGLGVFLLDVVGYLHE